MNYKVPLTLLGLGALSLGASAQQRNVIVILGDDYSCGEHGFYGNEIIQTPNLDALAGESAWLNNFYVGPTSSPTRAQLMTGKHEFRVGVTHTMYPRAYLNLEEKILPQYFSEAGYATGHFGKWHLGNDVFDDEYSARARGFDYSIVSDYREHFDPVMICNGELTAYKGFREDILFDEAQKWMDKQLDADKPFLCYVATNSAHSPFGCPEEYSQKYTDALGESTSLYYGMVDNVDDNVGEIIDYLKKRGIYENTLLIYMSDNGHVYHKGYNAGMRGGKNSEYRGGTRVPCLMHCPEIFDGGGKIDEMAGGIDILPTIADLIGFKLDKKIDGVSLEPLLSGKKELLKDRFMVCHTGRWDDGEAEKSKYTKYAVQNRRYRLVNNCELYDIENDPSETINIIDQEPKLVAQMRKFYEKWWAETLPLMVNDKLAFEQGGSRMSIDDVAYRELVLQPKDAEGNVIPQDVKYPLILDMVHHNPGEALYESVYNNPSMIKSMGYNGKVYFLFESPMLAINWESVDSDILPKGSEEREWVDQKANQIRSMQATSTQAGLTTLAQSDLILFPKRLVEKYDLADRMGDARDPEVERLIRLQIAEMFDQFPLLDGLVTRIGETYLHDAPYHVGAIDSKNDPEKTIIPLLEILRDEICVKRGKLLIFRTWVSFDTNLESYMKVNDSVEPHDKLIISVKHCEGDFHRSNPFSRVIGEGRHRQIIEIQCAREYEGKGAYPHYVANGVIEGFEEHDHMAEKAINSIREFALTKPDLYAGIWTWTRGGGWGGPYIQDELWCDINAWVVAQWASNPEQSEEEVFNRYATEKMLLKGDDVAKFRRLCLLSADAVVRGKNSIQSDIWRWWTRDYGISWPTFGANANVERAVAQKAESIEMWKEIVELANQIEWADEHTRQHVIGSCHYGLRLYEIYRVVVTMRAAYEKEDWAQVAQLIKEYDVAWAEYNRLPEEYSLVGTLYEKDYDRHFKTTADREIEILRNSDEVRKYL